MDVYKDLQSKCRSLRLAETAKALPELLREAENKSWTYHELISEVFEHELRCREKKNIEKLMKWAEFPEELTFETYALEEQNAIGKKEMSILQELHWVDDNFTLILMGPSGAGKTHLSVALGIHAVSKGMQVSFTSMPQLMYILKTKDLIKKSATRYKRIVTSDLVIIDDVRYMTFEPKEGALFFQFIYDMYDKTAFILTSNKGPGEWGKFLGDPTLTTAILDRLLHKSEILRFDNEADSIRMKYRKTIFESETV